MRDERVLGLEALLGALALASLDDALERAVTSARARAVASTVRAAGVRSRARRRGGRREVLLWRRGRTRGARNQVYQYAAVSLLLDVNPTPHHRVRTPTPRAGGIHDRASATPCGALCHEARIEISEFQSRLSFVLGVFDAENDRLAGARAAHRGARGGTGAPRTFAALSIGMLAACRLAWLIG